MPIGEYLGKLGSHQFARSDEFPDAPWNTPEVRNNLFALARAFGPLLEQKYQGAYRAGAQTLSRGRTQSQRNLMDEAAASGIAPGYAAGIDYASGNDFLTELAGLRSNAVAGQAGEEADFLTNLTSAFNENEQYRGSQYQQAYLAAKARSDAKKASKNALLGSLGSAVITGLGYAFGSPLGGAIAGSLTSKLGGGGGGGQNLSQQWVGPDWGWTGQPSFGGHQFQSIPDLTYGSA